MNFNQMRVILGVSSLKASVTAPRAFHVLGLVRFGLEYGLLATNANGLYFRVNGSHIMALDSDQVRRAIDFSYGAGGRLAAGSANFAGARSTARAPAVPLAPIAPRVFIRKHRHVPLSAMQSHHGMQAASA